MAVSLRLKSFDEIFNKTTNDKFFLNHEDVFNQENKEKLDRLIMRNYNEDTLSLIPSCDCGDLKGGYYVGTRCDACGTLVTSSIDEGLNFVLWLEQPQGVQRFISPIVLAVLLDRYKITKPGVQLISYLLIPDLRIEVKSKEKPPQLEKLDFLLAKEGISRGYNNIVSNFFKVIQILEDNYSKAKKVEKEEFLSWLFANQNNIFSTYLPFPNKSIFAIDSNELGSFIDRKLIEPLNAIRRLTGIDVSNKSSISKQTKVAKSLIELAGFYPKYLETSFFKKPGLIRQHVSSTRSHFTLRAVVTSIPGPHDYDEIQLPWSASATLFRVHLLKGLRRRGFNYKKAVEHLHFHNRIYSPVLDEIFKEILAATPNGIEALLNRNPSLHRGSIQTVRITTIKPDTTDNTMGVSFLIARSFNMDYDGDQLNLTLILTKRAREQLENFLPHHSVLGFTGPNEFGDAIQYPKTVISTLSNWFAGIRRAQ